MSGTSRRRNPQAGYAAFDSDSAVQDALRRAAEDGRWMTIAAIAAAAGVSDFTARVVVKELVRDGAAHVRRVGLPRFDTYFLKETRA